jgi:hypothetical protein
MYRNNYIIAAVTLLFTLVACNHDDNPEDTSSKNDNSMANYELVVTNISNGQPLTPLAVIVHGQAYSPWMLGESAGMGLEKLAESGDPGQFLMDASTSVFVEKTLSSAGGPFGPGMEKALSIETSKSSALQLSLATMLANTNDAFTGVKNWPIGKLKVGESMTTLSHVFDAGTEENTETSTTMPGPAANGEGFNAQRGGLDVVTIHQGVVTTDDGLVSSALNEQHRWLNYVAKITVTRVM